MSKKKPSKPLPPPPPPQALRRWFTASVPEGMRITQVLGDPAFLIGFQGTPYQPTQLTFSRTGRHIGISNGTQWDWRSRKTGLYETPLDEDLVPAINPRHAYQRCFHPTKPLIVLHEQGARTTLHNCATKQETRVDGMGTAALSVDGSLLFLVPPHTPDTLDYLVVDFDTQTPVHRSPEQPGHKLPFAALFTPENDAVWLQTLEHLYRWDLKNNSICCMVQRHSLPSVQLHRSAHPDRFLLVTETQIEERSYSDGELLRTFDPPTHPLAMDPDGTRYVYLFEQTLWEYDFDRRSRSPLRGYGIGCVHAIAVRDDEKLVAAARSDVIEVFNPNTKQRIAVLEGEEDPARRLLFSRDGQHLFSEHGNRIVRWSISDESAVAALDAERLLLTTVLTRDGETLVTAENVPTPPEAPNVPPIVCSYDARSLALVSMHRPTQWISFEGILAMGSAAESYWLWDERLEERDARTHKLLRSVTTPPKRTTTYCIGSTQPTVFEYFSSWSVENTRTIYTVSRWTPKAGDSFRVDNWQEPKALHASINERFLVLLRDLECELFLFEPNPATHTLLHRIDGDKPHSAVFGNRDGVLWIGTNLGMLVRLEIEPEPLPSAQKRRS